MNVSPVSGSVVLKAPTVVPAGWFSGTLLGDRAMSVGGALTESLATKASTEPPPLAAWRGLAVGKSVEWVSPVT